MFRSRPQAKAKAVDRWAVKAAAYSVAVIEWTHLVRELPPTIRVKDAGSRAAFMAAETSRCHLDTTRDRLLREAGRLGIDTPLPEAVWPDGKNASEAGSLWPRESA